MPRGAQITAAPGSRRLNVPAGAVPEEEADGFLWRPGRVFGVDVGMTLPVMEPDLWARSGDVGAVGSAGRRGVVLVPVLR